LISDQLATGFNKVSLMSEEPKTIILDSKTKQSQQKLPKQICG